jgi:hypothetical protein
MILSDRDIRARLAQGDLSIGPLGDMALQIQPASVDLRLRMVRLAAASTINRAGRSRAAFGSMLEGRPGRLGAWLYCRVIGLCSSTYLIG